MCGKEWIDRMEETTREVLDRVRSAIGRGLSEDEAADSVKYRDLCVLDEDYKDVHDRVEAVSVRILYRFLKGRES